MNASLNPGAFARLAGLLAGIAPPAHMEPLLLHMGEVDGCLPDPVRKVLAEPGAWEKYPPLGGTSELRAAYGQWLSRRFAAQLDLEREIEPAAGSKHALSLMISLAAHQAQTAHDGASYLAVPSPYYPTYQAAANASGLQVKYYEADPVRALGALAELLTACDGRCAAVVLCHPCTPSGRAYSIKELAEIQELARSHEALLIVDECYVDSYVERDEVERPAGTLAHAQAGDRALEGKVILHTLSKRSAAPGLRSGFVAGDAVWVRRFSDANRACGVSLSWAACNASALLWSDDAHASALRRKLRENWDVADQLLGGLPGYQRPPNGFYLCIPTHDDEAFVRRAWAEAGIKLMPGRYLSAPASALSDASPPAFVRAALTRDLSDIRSALYRLGRLWGASEDRLKAFRQTASQMQ